MTSLPPIVPIFPLPSVVLFPSTVVSLHVFEPRYRQMVRDTSEGPGLIGLALLKPGEVDQPSGPPAFHELGTVGRIEQLARLPDGRFTLGLVGLVRVRYHEVASDKPYRLARVVPIPETAVDDEEDEQLVRAKLDLLAAQAMLSRELGGEDDPTLIFDERMPFALAVNGACANLPVTAELRQELLALDDLHERQRRASRLITGLLESVMRLKAPVDQGEPGS